MKIQFDSQQQYQWDAVNAIVDVFDGQPLAGGQFEIRLGIGFGGAMTEMGFGNQLELSPVEILTNIQTIQERHEIDLQNREQIHPFSHSALREGWDNPNVFQICMLREVQSKVERRQTIGRGLRLPVDATGIRVFDPTINRLTVIANESYADFARALQTEIEEDCGVNFEGRIKNNRDRQKANLIPKWRENTDFLELWERIKHKTRYSVEYDTQRLIYDAARQINQMPAITAPQIRLEKVALGYANLIAPEKS